MKYCKKCKRFFKDEESVCKHCNKPLEKITDKNIPVYLLSSGGFELQRIKTALEDSGIPCSKTPKKRNISADIVTGCDYAEYDLLVPYAAYKKAYEVCIGIGAIKEGDVQIIDDNSADFQDDEEIEEMTPARRTAVRIFSAFLFIIVVALVIFATDYVVKLVQGLF